jgi:hypothetical protein
MNQIYEIGAVNAKMTGEEKGIKQSKMIVLSQEDIDAHPALAEAGFKAGDEVDGTEIPESEVPKEIVKKAKK